jgi:predicted O-methyltransferase YrrM
MNDKDTQSMSTTTLNSPRVASLLARLFRESEASNARLREMVGAISPEERARRMSDPHADYREFFARTRELYMAVSPATAKLLYMLARANGARAIVEFGTSFGISTIHLAAALHDNGGGRLIGSELELEKVERARTNLGAAGLDHLVDVRQGDALETLARDLPETVDLLLLDGHKPLYVPVLDLVAPRLRKGSFLVADNVDASPEYVARVRAEGGAYLSVPFAKDVEVSIKL